MSPFHIGYEDAKAGRGFYEHYESWDILTQMSYEAGRLVATNIKAATGSVTNWPRHAEGMTPQIKHDFIASCQSCGNPFPVNRRVVFRLTPYG